MTYFVTLVFTLAGFLVGSHSFATDIYEFYLETKPIQAGDYFEPGVGERGAQYTTPNEWHPEKGLKLYQSAKSGALVTTGAERGWIAAALATNITSVYFVDLVEEVCLYNLINFYLLTLAKKSDLADYLALRMATEHSKWLKALTDRGYSAQDSIFKVLSHPNNFQFFQAASGTSTKLLQENELFIETSYLRDQNQFDRIQELARSGRVWVMQANLQDEKSLNSLSGTLEERGESLSLLDLSNAWEARYIGPNGVSKIVESLRGSGSDDSIMIATRYIGSRGHQRFWNYFGFTWGYLNAQMKYGLDIDSVTKAEQNGRLYTTADARPFHKSRGLMTKLLADCWSLLR